MGSVDYYLKRPLYVIFDNITGAVECITGLFETNYVEIQKDTASIGNWVLATTILFGVIFLAIIGAKKRWLSIISLLTCVIYSMQEKIIAAINGFASDKYKFLKKVSDIVNGFEQWHIFVASVVIASIISYFFTKLMYIGAFLIYAIGVFFLYMQFGDKLESFTMDIPQDGFIKYVNNPAVIFAVLMIVFYFIQELIIAIVFAALGTLLVALIIEIIVIIDNRPVKKFFLQLKRYKISDDMMLVYWGALTVVFLMIQFNVPNKLKNMCFSEKVPTEYSNRNKRFIGDRVEGYE